LKVNNISRGAKNILTKDEFNYSNAHNTTFSKKKKKKIHINYLFLSLCLDPLFWECILAGMHSARMHFAKNSAFGTGPALGITKPRAVQKNEAIYL
jgi:hypothetical protein